MADFNSRKILNYDDLVRFENERTLDQRLPERSILDVFIASAAEQSDLYRCNNADDWSRR